MKNLKDILLLSISIILLSSIFVTSSDSQIFNSDPVLLKEGTFEFVENVLNEVMDLFPSQYIHIGGDECNKEAWKVDPDCQKRMKEEGIPDPIINELAPEEDKDAKKQDKPAAEAKK